MNVLIIGAGISGLSLGRLLLEKGISAKILEAKNNIGGLVHCDKVDHFLYHRVGGHVFNTKSSHVSDWFWSYFDKESEFYLIERNARILLEGQ